MSFLPFPAENTSQAVALIKQDGAILHDIVHGDETQEVLTENGLVPSVDKLIYDINVRVGAGTAADITLRPDLAAVDSDILIAGVPARAFRTVNGVKNLLLVGGVVQSVSGFYVDSDDGGGDFVYYPTLNKSLHNGVTVIAPEALLAWDGTYTGLSTLHSWTGSGNGLFVRAHSIPLANPEFSILWAGARVGLDSAKAIQKCIDLTQAAFDVVSGNNQFPIVVPSARFYVEEELLVQNAYNLIVRGGGKRYSSCLQVSASISETAPLWSMIRFGSGTTSNIQFENIELGGNNRAVFVVDHTNRGTRPSSLTGYAVTYNNVTISGVKDGCIGVRGLSYDAKMNNCDVFGHGTAPTNSGEWRGAGVSIYSNANGCSFQQTWFRRLTHGVIQDPLFGGAAHVTIGNSCLFDNMRRAAIVLNWGANSIGVSNCYFEAVNDGGTANMDVVRVGQANGTGATATANIVGGQITSVTVTNGGSGYTLPPVVTITGDGFGFEAYATVAAGAVTGIVVRCTGYLYTTATVSFPSASVMVSAAIVAAAYQPSAATAYVESAVFHRNKFISGNSDDIFALSGFHKVDVTCNRVSYRGGISSGLQYNNMVRSFGYGVQASLFTNTGRSLLMEGNEYWSPLAAMNKPSVVKLFSGDGLSGLGRYLNGIVIKDHLQTHKYSNLDTLVDMGYKAFLEQSVSYSAAYTDASEGILRVTKSTGFTPSTVSLAKHLPKLRGSYVRLEVVFISSTAGVNPIFTLNDGVDLGTFEPSASAGNVRSLSAPYYIDSAATELTLTYNQLGADGTYHDIISFNVVPACLDIGCGREVR